MTIQFMVIIISMTALLLIGGLCFHKVMINRPVMEVVGCYRLIDGSRSLDIFPFKEANQSCRRACSSECRSGRRHKQTHPGPYYPAVLFRSHEAISALNVTFPQKMYATGLCKGLCTTGVMIQSAVLTKITKICVLLMVRKFLHIVMLVTVY